MPQSLEVLIVGAGVAGLAAAVALEQCGHAVDIIERRSENPSGAGLFLPGNSVRALTALGVRDRLAEFGVPIHHQQLRDHRGRVLADIDTTALWRDNGHCLGITHGRLHSILRENLRVPVRTGISVDSVAETSDRVQVEFNDGGSGRYDVVIGADGIRSNLRRRVNPDAEAQYVGQICWRFLTANNAGIDRWTVWLGRGTTFLAVPMGENRLYCYADASTDLPANPVEGATLLTERFSDFDSRVRELLATPEAQQAHYSTIEEVTDPTWRTDRIVLVGDAAHASSPNMAQGVAMAVEDALVLAESLSGAGDIADLLERYRIRRLPRTRWMQARTHRRDRTRSLAPAIRNTVLRLAANRMYEADYAPLRDAP
ncbi:FAD-dependent monooxygenase [Nocardia sp. NPDC051030]|uniref:FAD-dependent monooxygenase n=1 Tax=Nocardia sp. NPDC051030 TaxID=3155162 RepID=UPI003439DC0D